MKSVRFWSSWAGEAGGELRDGRGKLPDLGGHPDRVLPGGRDRGRTGGVVMRQPHGVEEGLVGRGIGVGQRGGAATQVVGLGSRDAVAEPGRHPGSSFGV